MPTIDVNLLLKAPTQYTGIDFNSYANFNGKQLAVSSNGLFQVCCGDDDDGTIISAYFSPVKTDLGIKQPKRLRFLYFGFKSDENMEIEVQADDGTKRTYQIPANSNGQQRTRIAVGRDGRGRYWSFKIKNKSGYDFDMDSIQVMPVVLSEGFK